VARSSTDSLTRAADHTDRAVAFDPARLELVDAAGTSASALGGDALAGAIVAGPAGERVCGELLPSGHLVFPPGRYREARITIDDVETGEAEGFVTPVQ